MTEVVVAVRDLAAFCHRSGDIDHRFAPSPTGVEGVAGHQRVYRRRPASYRSEYPVSYRHAEGDRVLLLRGRADGYDAERGVVEEIKTCRLPPGQIPPVVSRMHLAQGRLYAALIAREQDLAGLEVHLTWFHVDSGEEHTLVQPYSRAELDDFLAASLARFSTWLGLLADLRQRRDASISALGFPHGEFRPGQREIAELVYRCISGAGQLLVEAPTGIGKTAAVLFPALKALATDRHDRVVFVTARTVGRRAAEETLALCARAGVQLRALTLTAKERICLAPGRACHGDDCPYARGYYDRLPAALAAAMASPALTREDIEALARRFEVCPYQLGLDLLPWVDLVIGDIHYLYSLTATLGDRLQQDGRRCTVLLDEAHNLPDRARGMYRTRLDKAELMAVKREAPATLVPALAKVNRALLALRREDWRSPDADTRAEVPAGLLLALRELVVAVGEISSREPARLHRQPALLDFHFRALQFLRVADNWGEEFRCELARGGGRQALTVTLNCLDPARLLAQRQQSLHAVAAFSATLSPAGWMRAALGLGPTAVFRRLDSPFAADQLRVTLATGVDTRYRHREASLAELGSTLLRWLGRESGNAIVYFPSYKYLQQGLGELERQGLAGLGRRLWVQRREQEDPARDELFSLLDTRRDVAALCILGGVFGEGIDLPGERLTGVAVVGVGLPGVSRETEQLRDYFQQHRGAGFEYAYLYPGMQKVSQALGRVVRGTADRGTALLIDRRYGERRYRELLPPWWHYDEVRETG